MLYDEEAITLELRLLCRESCTVVLKCGHMRLAELMMLTRTPWLLLRFSLLHVSVSTC